MYEETTHGIRIRVVPQFVEDQSRPDEDFFFWAYTVEITNDSDRTVQLKSRVWHITDAQGRNEEVRGPGVVGKTPVIAPGETFSYTSGCPLSTTSGIMVGSYVFDAEGGESFVAKVPAFSLDSPYSVPRVN